MTEKQTGVILVAIGAVLFSAKAIFIKLAYAQYEVDDITLLTLRFGFALPFFFAIAVYRSRKGKFKSIAKRDWLIIALLSMLGYYIASYFDFMGLKYITAGLERIILFIYPTLVVIFSSLFLGKSISRNAYIALGVTYLGIIIIAFDPHIFETPNLIKGGSMILISAITYALYLVFGGEQINKYGSANFNSIAMVFSSFYVLIHFSAVQHQDIFSLEPGLYAYGMALAIFSTILPTFMVMEGIKLLGANLGSIVASIGPVSTIVLGYFFLGESFTFQELIGSAFVLGGVLMIGK
ncbi:Threonine/homoserine efflux transporter RhtA [Spirosomataceae bacterium TFI 002]|nr:Threonine/homoserine efflux transporter RhtA [Spirosomataceae bacterium TFI 002]